MIRRTALILCLSAAACAQEESLPEEPVGTALQASLTAPTEEDAIRFLEQATFGPRLAAHASPLAVDTVEHVETVGITAAITEQLAKPAGSFDGTATSLDLGSQFFYQAVTGEDQLRLRAAFALSQIWVVSQNGVPDPGGTAADESKQAVASYMNVLRQNAFGDFRVFMEAVTLDPAMGRYLDMVNNRAFDSAGNAIEPNENFARELLQLFTLGLHQLNDDGTLKYDCNGDGVADPASTCPATDPNAESLPAYTELDVQAFARALSGWTYAKIGGTGDPALDCPAQGGQNPVNYAAPMIGCANNHDSSAQTLLRGVSISAGSTPQQHLKRALDNIFNDSNLPPFICKQLIQHLVTSNPSADYVKRVVKIFKNDTSPTAGGVRGNMAAVLRAILEDDEARGSMAPLGLYNHYGHLRSPALFVTNMARWLTTLDTSGGKDPGGKLGAWSKSMGQSVPRPPSVFSYYPPNAVMPGGGGLVAPEFGILDTATITARANFMHELLFTNAAANAGVDVDLTRLPANQNDMVDWLGRYWLHDDVSSALQLSVYGAITHASAGTVASQKKLALYLTGLSPELQIQR